jgi:hypothetical protein
VPSSLGLLAHPQRLITRRVLDQRSTSAAPLAEGEKVLHFNAKQLSRACRGVLTEGLRFPAEDLTVILNSPARQNRCVRLATKVDKPQAAVSCFDASDGGVIGPEAHDIVPRERRRNSDVDRNKVREDDAVLGQAIERIQEGLPPRKIVRRARGARSFNSRHVPRIACRSHCCRARRGRSGEGSSATRSKASADRCQSRSSGRAVSRQRRNGLV